MYLLCLCLFRRIVTVAFVRRVQIFLLTYLLTYLLVINEVAYFTQWVSWADTYSSHSAGLCRNFAGRQLTFVKVVLMVNYQVNVA